MEKRLILIVKTDWNFICFYGNENERNDAENYASLEMYNERRNVGTICLLLLKPEKPTRVGLWYLLFVGLLTHFVRNVVFQVELTSD